MDKKSIADIELQILEKLSKFFSERRNALTKYWNIVNLEKNRSVHPMSCTLPNNCARRWIDFES